MSTEIKETIELPELLYRGDNDNKKERSLRETINKTVLLTNLSCGGNGQEIFQNSLESLINKHVATGWKKTHFLSFTSDKEKAFYYGCGGAKKEYYQTFSSDNWDFVLLALATSLFFKNSVIQIGRGAYKASYIPLSREFLPLYTIVLIDVKTYLKEYKNYYNNFSESIYNAERDKEWLIYPTTPMLNNSEFTSKLDMGCISEKETYRF